MIRRLLPTLSLVLLLTRPLAAQTGALLVSYQVDVFDIAVDPFGTEKPIWSMTMAASAVTCNQVPLPNPTTLTQLNPQVLYWTDPVNAGKICKASAVLLGTLPPLVGSTYVLTVSVTDDRGLVSPRAVVSLPFNNGAPKALTGVGVR